MMRIRPFTEADTDDVVALWTTTGLVRPWNDPRADIRRKLRVQPELFLVAAEGTQLLGTIMGGYDGHRGSVYYLAVDPARRREGIGRALLTEIERLLTDLGCPKLSLLVRSDNLGVLGFYRGLGYGEDQVVSLGKRLLLDEG